MSNKSDVMERLARAEAALAQKTAELEALAAKRNSPRVARNIPTFPKVDVVDEKTGQLTQRELSQKLIGSGGAWYTVAHVAETLPSGEKVIILRKYQSVNIKDAEKAREGEKVGDKVLRQKSSFRINSQDHWKQICALGNECFAAPTAE